MSSPEPSRSPARWARARAKAGRWNRAEEAVPSGPRGAKARGGGSRRGTPASAVPRRPVRPGPPRAPGRLRAQVSRSRSASAAGAPPSTWASRAERRPREKPQGAGSGRRDPFPSPPSPKGHAPGGSPRRVRSPPSAGCGEAVGTDAEPGGRGRASPGARSGPRREPSRGSPGPAAPGPGGRSPPLCARGEAAPPGPEARARGPCAQGPAARRLQAPGGPAGPGLTRPWGPQRQPRRVGTSHTAVPSLGAERSPAPRTRAARVFGRSFWREAGARGCFPSKLRGASRCKKPFLSSSGTFPGRTS